MLKAVLVSIALAVVLAGSSRAQSALPDYHELRSFSRTSETMEWSFYEDFAFSADGSKIAAAVSDITMNVWDIESGTILHTFDHATTSVSWSPDGAFIASVSYHGLLRLWDSATGELHYEIPAGFGWHIAWSPDSTRLATTDLKVYDAQTGEVILELGENWGMPFDVYWSPDGEKLATTSGHERDFLNIWSLQGERLDTYWAGSTAAWSPDSTRLASTGQVRDISTGLPVTIIPEMDDVIAWHPSEPWIASTSNLRAKTGDTIYLWDAETGDLLTSWTLPDCFIRAFVWSPDGERFAVNCYWGQAAGVESNNLAIWERIR